MTILKQAVVVVVITLVLAVVGAFHVIFLLHRVATGGEVSFDLARKGLGVLVGRMCEARPRGQVRLA